MKTKNLNSVDQIIQHFGGQSALAALIGKRQSTVQHWAKTGRIPSQWHRTLLKLAREKGIALEAKDFITKDKLDIAPASGHHAETR
jgi:DNA-binding transcriptional regulator YdaS (Cro superfamily)